MLSFKKKPYKKVGNREYYFLAHFTEVELKSLFVSIYFALIALFVLIRFKIYEN